MAVAKPLQPEQWWVPLKGNEERMVRANLRLFIELFLMRFGYGAPRNLETNEWEDRESWGARFTARMTNSHTIKGEISYLPKSNSLILSVSA